MWPECSVEFGTMMPRPTPPYEEFWVRLDFELAAFASTKPHRDDENLLNVSGYNIVPRARANDYAASQNDRAEWLRTGICPDPSFYFSVDSRWLETERSSWAARQRTDRQPENAVHFLLDGRDGYVEILASGFRWRAWRQGRPRLSAVSGEPVMSGAWVDGDARLGGGDSDDAGSDAPQRD
jgi:hypothetical protein